MIARPSLKTITAARVALLTAGLGLGSLAFALPATAPISSSTIPSYAYAPVAASNVATSVGTSVVSFRASSLGAFADLSTLGLGARSGGLIDDAFKIVSVQGPSGVSVTLDSASLRASNSESGTPAMLDLSFSVTTPDFAYGETPIEVTLENTRTGEQTVIGLDAIAS